MAECLEWLAAEPLEPMLHVLYGELSVELCLIQVTDREESLSASSCLLVRESLRKDCSFKEILYTQNTGDFIPLIIRWA
jgi:hypothetical protein